MNVLSESTEGSELDFFCTTMWHRFYDVLGLFIEEKQDVVQLTIQINIMKILM